MTHDLRYLAASIILGLVQILLASWTTAAQRQGGWQWAAGPRDEPRLPPTPLAGRLTRSQQNYAETFTFFVAALMIGHATGNEGWLTGIGSALFFWARLAYLPLYALGVPYLRSLAWAVATAGILVVLSASVFAVGS